MAENKTIGMIVAVLVIGAVTGAILGILGQGSKVIKIETSEESVQVKVSSSLNEEACETFCNNWYLLNFVKDDTFIKQFRKYCGYDLPYTREIYFCAFYMEGIAALNIGGEREEEYLSVLKDYGLKINWDEIKKAYNEKGANIAKRMLRESLAGALA